MGFGENTQRLPKKPSLHLPVFYTSLCSAHWTEPGNVLLAETDRKFQPGFIFHLSCMGFNKGCGVVLGTVINPKWMHSGALNQKDAVLQIKLLFEDMNRFYAIILMQNCFSPKITRAKTF